MSDILASNFNPLERFEILYCLGVIAELRLAQTIDGLETLIFAKYMLLGEIKTLDFPMSEANGGHLFSYAKQKITRITEQVILDGDPNLIKMVKYAYQRKLIPYRMTIKDKPVPGSYVMALYFKHRGVEYKLRNVISKDRFVLRYSDIYTRAVQAMMFYVDIPRGIEERNLSNPYFKERIFDHGRGIRTVMSFDHDDYVSCFYTEHQLTSSTARELIISEIEKFSIVVDLGDVPDYMVQKIPAVA